MQITDHVPFSHPWPEAALKIVADILVGGTPSTLVPSFWGGDIRWMSSGDVHLKQIYDVPGRITNEGLRRSNAKLVDPPAVAIALAGQGKTRGTAAVTRVTVCTNQSVALVKSRNEELDIEYLFHNLEFRYEELRARSAGGGRAGLSKSIIEALPIPLPEPIEQGTIALILNVIDDTIGKTERLILKLARIKQGLAQDLLTRGIDENGVVRSERTHKVRDSHLGRFPQEWRISSLGEALDGIDAGKSPDYPDRSAPPGEWGVLKVSAIRPEGFRPQENKWVTKAIHQNRKFEVRNGDLLISRANTYELVGLVCLVCNAPPRLLLCDKTLRLCLKPSRGSSAFFALVLQTRMVRQQIEVNATGTSGSMKNISQHAIRSLRLAYPDIKEQNRILAVIAPMDAELDSLSRERAKLVALKHGLMADLLTGKVRVNHLIKH